ncbi:toll/interleukin-1 receptor domain-containing protein [Prosthecobacter fluviatilis]|uniref:Toll/interleukin-1 receptor domain-containing protein n=1 Tax=Prosthecobacter fluviatilis TaxID=445931 RepID=A0ABW0KQN9_9BACT
MAHAALKHVAQEKNSPSIVLTIMKQIFISHATADSHVANKLAEDLKMAGHEVRIDTKDLGLGDDVVEFMEDGINRASAVIILHSKNSAQAKWQKKEINAAIWKEVADSGGTCIVIKLDDTKISTMLGPKVWGTLNLQDTEGYKNLIEKICSKLLPSETATSVVNAALKLDSPNPFRRIRAEYFEERTDLLSRAFASPDASKTGTLEEITPCFLEGSRGTGKSMLLLSLRARVYISRQKSSSDRHKIFGFYLKFTRGAFCNIGVSQQTDNEGSGSDILKAYQEEIVADIGAQEFIVCLLESLFSELHQCSSQNLLQINGTCEAALVDDVYKYVFVEQVLPPRTFLDLMAIFAKLHRLIADFIRRKFIYQENTKVPIASLDLEALKHVIEIVKSHIPEIKNSLFVALLDEYENLFPFQQRVVNTFVKLAAPALSVKVAKKLGTSEISGTTIGQELQETHDYTRMMLVYDVEDPASFKVYRDLLEHIVKNILDSEGLSISINELLPDFQDDEVPSEGLIRRVAELAKMTTEELANLPDKERREKTVYYREAATYRELYGQKGAHPEKRFAGFKTLSLLSSGVIRYFQEMLAVAYYLRNSSESTGSKLLTLKAEVQTKAAHLVSKHNLTTLGRNVESDGEMLKFFLLDLGDCLRHKLLKHGSEPEAARLTIVDPENLERPTFLTLRRILNVGTREGIFQTREGRPAFKPRHSSDPQSAEFNVSRIFAPVLQISPRLRWRTSVHGDDLRQLLDPLTRARAKRSLMKALEGGSAARNDRTLL